MPQRVFAKLLYLSVSMTVILHANSELAKKICQIYSHSGSLQGTDLFCRLSGCLLFFNSPYSLWLYKWRRNAAFVAFHRIDVKL